MADELLAWLKGQLQNRFVCSFDNADLLAWGTRQGTNVQLLGITANVGVNSLDAKISTPTLAQMVEAGRQVSAMAHTPKLLVILYPKRLDSESTFSFAIIDSEIASTKRKIIRGEDLGEFLQHHFGTNLRSFGTRKDVNVSTSDAFHRWARENLPSDYVRIDVDGLFLGRANRPSLTIEVKRSFMEPEKWRPYLADAPNYRLQFILASKAELNYWTIYHKKGESVNRDSTVCRFKIRNVSLEEGDQWIDYDRRVCKAGELLEVLERSK